MSGLTEVQMRSAIAAAQAQQAAAGGMRAVFAAQQLAALVAYFPNPDGTAPLPGKDVIDQAADLAVDLADALLRRLARPPA